MSLHIRDWMAEATSSEQEELAKLAGTSRGYLYALAAGNRTASVDLAARLEGAAVPIRRKSKGRLPKLSRVAFSTTCGSCPFAMQCGASLL